jgi:hypothetical protein
VGDDNNGDIVLTISSDDESSPIQKTSRTIQAEIDAPFDYTRNPDSAHESEV